MNCPGRQGMWMKTSACWPLKLTRSGFANSAVVLPHEIAKVIESERLDHTPAYRSSSLSLGEFSDIHLYTYHRSRLLAILDVPTCPDTPIRISLLFRLLFSAEIGTRRRLLDSRLSEFPSVSHCPISKLLLHIVTQRCEVPNYCLFHPFSYEPCDHNLHSFKFSQVS